MPRRARVERNIFCASLNTIHVIICAEFKNGVKQSRRVDCVVVPSFSSIGGDSCTWILLRVHLLYVLSI